MNKKRMLIITLTLLLSVSLLAGCGSSEGGNTDDGNNTEAKELRIAMDYEPETLDQAQFSGDTSLITIRLIEEPLLRDVNGKPEEGLAESYEANDDMTEYTFHLREAAFSDGTPITAGDIYYAVMRTLDPEEASPAAYHLYDIKGAEDYNLGNGSKEDVGIKVIDDSTITFTMRDTTFPIMFTQVDYAPINEEFLNSCGDGYGAEAENVKCCGPFTITEWTHESKIVLEKNENYWNADNINVSKITFSINATAQTAADMMMAGELDAAALRDKTIVDSLLESENFTNKIYYSGYQFIHINHAGRNEETGKWLSNKNFRLALSYAIDREDLVASVYTTDEAASRITAPSEVGINKSFNEEYPIDGWPTTDDPEKAKEYLALAMEDLGVNDVSEIPEFSMLCYDSQNNMNCLNAIADMWSKNLGIKAYIDAQTLNTMLDKANNTGDFDFWKGGKAFGYTDWLTEVGEMYLSTSGNPINNQDPEYDKLYEATRTATTLEERDANLAELEQYYADNMLGLVVTWNQQNLVYDSNIEGINITADGYVDWTYADINA